MPLFYSSKQKTAKTFSKELVDDLIETTIRFNTKSGDTIQAKAVAENEIDFFVTWNKKDFVKMEEEIDCVSVLNPTEMINKLKN